MSQSSLPPDLVPRLVCYGIDDRTRAMLREVWESLEPQVDSIVEELLHRAAKLPHGAVIDAERGERIVAIERDHMRLLMTDDFGAGYRDSCRRAAELAEYGFETDGRMLLAALVMARASALLAAEHRFAGAALAERTSALMRAMVCDIATVSALALQAREESAEARQREVDAAIQALADTSAKMRVPPEGMGYRIAKKGV
jgi:hypothetical protein